jgi:hypothetical protein
VRYQEAPPVKKPRSSSLCALDLDDDERNKGRRSPKEEIKKANDIMK